MLWGKILSTKSSLAYLSVNNKRYHDKYCFQNYDSLQVPLTVALVKRLFKIKGHHTLIP